MTNVLLIHNADAGDGGHSAEELHQAVGGAGRRTVYQSSRLDDFACLLGEPWDLIVVAGGDGAVTRTLRACAGHPAPVAVIPLGTANNVASGLGHLGRAGELAQRWDLSLHADFHLGQALSGWGMSRFAESFGIGLLAQTIVTGEAEAHEQFADRYEKLGTLSARMLELVERLAPERLEIDLDGKDYSGDYLWMEAGRVGSVGPNLPIAPWPDPWGNELQIALLPAERRASFIEHLKAREGGDHTTELGFRMLRGADLTISWPGFRSHIDGVVLPRGAAADEMQSVRVGIHPKPVRILTLR
jgi:diacylglycerol kinase family enzyme